MARRIMEQTETATRTAERCDHPLVSIPVGGPATWRACDPRLLFSKLPPILAARCRQARAQHHGERS